MANNCMYDMTLVGPRRALKRFEKMVNYKDKKNCFCRVFSAYCELKSDGTMTVFGDCAWSFEGCFLGNTRIETDENGIAGRKRWNLNEWCRENGCCYEMWSEEPELCFVEHAWYKSDDDSGYECDEAEWDWDEKAETYGQVISPTSYGEFDIVLGNAAGDELAA